MQKLLLWKIFVVVLVTGVFFGTFQLAGGTLGWAVFLASLAALFVMDKDALSTITCWLGVGMAWFKPNIVVVVIGLLIIGIVVFLDAKERMGEYPDWDKRKNLEVLVPTISALTIYSSLALHSSLLAVTMTTLLVGILIGVYYFKRTTNP